MQYSSMEQCNHEEAFLLGEWQVLPHSGLLIKDGIQVRAEPKVMSVLECLLRAGGRLVTREELIDKVWTHVVVNDEVLTRAISELRTLLGDVGRDRRYIATIPKRGYKLLMPVLPMAVPADNSPPQNDHSRTRRAPFTIQATAFLLWCTARRLLSQSVALAGGFALSSMLALSLWMTASDVDEQARIPANSVSSEVGELSGNSATLPAEWQHFQVSGALTSPVQHVSGHAAQRVLITPLTPITDDDQTRIFAAGLSEDLQDVIFRETELQIVQQLSDNPMESAFILSGSVRVYGQSTKVNFQLVESGTSRLLWSGSFECPLDAILSIQTQIARQAGQKLQRSLSGRV